MKLSSLLQSHGQFSPGSSLKGNLGDGYLMTHNRIFRRVREEALLQKVKFTSERFYDYDALSLTQLPKILRKKSIPYCNNVRALWEIEKAVPEVFEWSEIPPLRANYVLHETAHVLARLKTIKHFKNLNSKNGVEEKNLRLLLVLIEEAFANTCESLANADATSEMHDEFLFKNSYVMEKEIERKVMRKSIENLGSSMTFKILFFSFLHANFLKTRIEVIDFSLLVRIVFFNDEKRRDSVCSKKNLRLIKQVFQIGFDLDPQFTYFTNAFCIRLMGIKGELSDLLEFDFLTYFEQARFQNLLEDFGTIVG